MTYLKLILGLALVVAIGLGLRNVYDTYHQRDELVLSNATLTKKNNDLAAALALNKRQGQNSTDATQNNASQTLANNAKVDDIKATQTNTRQSIIIKYAAQPQTPDNKLKRDAELSLADFNAMWSTFCSLGNKGQPCESLKQQQ